ncbi:hypothetical protein ACIQBJ_14220 [Kitasatospora sp. NPDC088391]|uniref:phage fiber-tail adaptor protein n=1 Tax=Kitasatospora sp. NPDC088391 TaxID=3364074 RepID=UPI0037F4F6EE
MATNQNLKDPDAILDWIWDWSDWLASGETIATSTFITSAGITVPARVPLPGGGTVPGASNTTTTATVWWSGGSPSQPYLITNRITTSAGRTDDRSITVRVIDR